MSKFLDFYKTSPKADFQIYNEKVYKKDRIQAFIAATLGYSLYYVCRTTLNVVKEPIIDGGILNAGELGIISSCLLFSYAIGKFVNGFLADYSNIKRFMATGLAVSTLANFIMGCMGFAEKEASLPSLVFMTVFAITWCINGWAQSMGAPPAIISLSRWFPLKIRGTFYGFFSASHNFGEGLSFIFVGLIVGAFGWQWGFAGASIAGMLGVILILFWLRDTPESQGLPPVEVISGEKTQEEYESEAAEKLADRESSAREVKEIQKAVLRNPGVWILAASSAFMYMSRYAINGWGMLFLQKVKGFDIKMAGLIIGVNTIFGVLGTVFSGWLSDSLFRGNRKYPALLAGILEAISLALFLYSGKGLAINIMAMILFGISIGVLICFVGGLMAVELVPRKATGSALGIVGLASYAAAGIQDIVSGQLIDKNISTLADGTQVYDFSHAAIFWIGAAVISFLLPLLNWKRRPSA